MKQLTKHIMSIRFYKPSAGGEYNLYLMRVVNCADIDASRQIGLDIAEWMALGVGYRVESETIKLERK